MGAGIKGLKKHPPTFSGGNVRERERPYYVIVHESPPTKCQHHKPNVGAGGASTSLYPRAALKARREEESYYAKPRGKLGEKRERR